MGPLTEETGPYTVQRAVVRNSRPAGRKNENELERKGLMSEEGEDAESDEVVHYNDAQEMNFDHLQLSTYKMNVAVNQPTPKKQMYMDKELQAYCN